MGWFAVAQKAATSEPVKSRVNNMHLVLSRDEVRNWTAIHSLSRCLALLGFLVSLVCATTSTRAQQLGLPDLALYPLLYQREDSAGAI